MVTKGWAEKRIDDVTRIIDSLHQTPKFSPSGIPMVRVADIKGGKLDTSNTAMVTYEIYEKFTKNYKPQKGDIVFSRVGSYGNSSYVASEEPFCLGQNTVVINPTCVDGLFLYYSLQSEKLKRQIDTEVDGSSHKTISLKVIKDLRVLVPPSPEQKKIARILSTWDAAIESVEKLIENSRQQKKALMQQLLTGKKRLPGFSREWKRMSVGQMGKILSGGTPDTENPELWNGEVLWATPTDITSLNSRYIKATIRNISKKGLQNSSANLLPPNSLLICTRATIGFLAISTSNITTNQGFKNLIPNANFDVCFLYYLFSYFRNNFIRLASGSTFLELSKMTLKN